MTTAELEALQALLEATMTADRLAIVASLEERITRQLKALARYQSHETAGVAVAAAESINRIHALLLELV